MSKKKNDNSKDLSQAIEITPNTNHPHAPVYSSIEHYCLDKFGCLWYSKGDKSYQLCNGSIIIKKEVYKFSGNGEPEICFLIEGITRNGIKLPEITVQASEFASLNWVTKNWGTSLVVMPNQTVKQILAAGILMSGEQCKRERVCTHTGYIIKNNKPINYMSASGSLLPSDIKCELPDDLKNYRLSGVSSSDSEKKEAIEASIRLLSAHVPEVTGPLFAYTYLAPILPIVNTIIGRTSFLLFLQGKTQSGKSTIAALSTSHFGIFDSQTPPTTFASTANAIGYIANVLKDSSAWIDDFHPDANGMKKQDSIMQGLSRMTGENTSRLRLDSNAKLKESYPPRCIFLVTGEIPPKIGQSGHARLFQIDVPEARRDISVIKKEARNGVLSRAMSDYIAYIIADFDRLKDIARKKYEELLDNQNELFGACRLSNQAALLCLSASMFFDYTVQIGALSVKEATDYYMSIESAVTLNARKKEEQLKQEDPCELYINAIKDLLSSGRAKVIDLTKRELPEEAMNYPYASLSLGPDRDGFIGWKDEKGYYLNTNASYSAVTTYYTRQDMSFVTNPNTLWRQLRDSKYLIPDKNNTPCQNKKIGGEARRVLWFPRKVFDSYEE